MTDFFRFPSTPHLAWLGGATVPREDKLLSPSHARALLAGEVVVEEKIDGANVGFSLAKDGTLLVQNRGQYLTSPYTGQFARLPEWLAHHGERIRDQLDASLLLFGEWSAARHSIEYNRLPDWLLVFDVYDREAARFWSTSRRNALASAAGLKIVPTLLRGLTNLAELEHLLAERSSRYRAGPMEGVIVRSENLDWSKSRAKLVHADFTQAIDEHWSRRHVKWNRVDWSVR
ncbi:DNA ligase III-like protein [Xanthobacter versatilis]|uniref:DNA ligase III-like protein n=1 Tax=Xanthobacter autotrophicus (strain ATCC BAA-1158 / Py2) TaxID=78245 RepID=A7ILS0_XANP2|nr:DNA ligase III-like protein [Xanthobacter autotrophicus Py2]